MTTDTNQTCDCGGEMLSGICLFCGWWPGRADQPPGELRNGVLYARDGSPMPSEQPFVAWVAQVQAEAKRRLGRDDVEWLIGDERDLKESFTDGMSPTEYIDEQVASID